MDKEYQTGTSESVKKSIDKMDKPFILIVETDNGYLGDYDAQHQMGNALIELGKRVKSGRYDGLIRDLNENVIGRFDWWA